MKKRKKTSIRFTEPSLTKQADRDACNINNIMARYEKTGIVDHVMSSPGTFGDFSDVDDYQDALNKIQAAQALFDALPAQVRAKFENDPTLFLEFAQNPENYDQLVDMGLALPKTPDTAAPEPTQTTEPTQGAQGDANQE